MQLESQKHKRTNKVLNVKPYTNKIPPKVRVAMENFADGDCLLVERNTKDIDGVVKQGNCHLNVKQLVDKFGGELVCGWLLYRSNQFINDGFYAWNYHAVWLTADNKLYDVTEDRTYGDALYSTFWVDKKRTVDLDKGVSYNCIVAMENRDYADAFGKSVGQQVNLGEVYWATGNYRHIKKLSEHSGIYKLMRPEYPENIKSLEKEYNCKIVDGKLIPNKGNDDKVSIDIVFDYSLSS